MVYNYISIGKYRRAITLQTPVEEQGTMGGIKHEWKDFAVSIPAAIEPLNGRELYAAQQVANDVTTKISIRWRPGIDTTNGSKMRILHATNLDQQTGPNPQVFYEIFNVEAVMFDLTGRKEIQFLCKSRANAGFRADG